LAFTAVERMHVNAMAGSQDTGVAGAHAIGVTLALSNGVPEGIAAIQQGMVSLDSTMAAGAVRLEVLIKLAEALHTLGSPGVVPAAARTAASLPEPSPTMEARPALTAGELSSAAFSQPARDALRPPTAIQSEVASQSPRSTAVPEQAHLVPDISSMPSLASAGTDTQQEDRPTAPTMPAGRVSVVQASPVRPRNAATNEDAAAPVDQLPGMSADLTATSLNAVQNTAFASAVLAPAMVAPTAIAPTSITPTSITPTSIAPMTVAPPTARAKDVPGDRSTLPFEMMIAAARSQELLMTGPSAPPTALPTSQIASGSPLITPRTEAPTDQAMPTDQQRPPSMSRQSPDTAAEPRQGTLILDGTQLGRWIMDRIARQASRPVAGTTGIDPRISPTFPGAPASV
jgi:hypothetical protein